MPILLRGFGVMVSFHQQLICCRGLRPFVPNRKQGSLITRLKSGHVNLEPFKGQPKKKPTIPLNQPACFQFPLGAHSGLVSRLVLYSEQHGG